MTKIIGEFEFTPPSWLRQKSSGLTLIIGTRKKATPDKPVSFLLMELPTGRRQFVSSLYPSAGNKAKNDLKTYYFDYGKVGYVLTMDYSSYMASISNNSTPPSFSANPINNAEKGVKFTPPHDKA